MHLYRFSQLWTSAAAFSIFRLVWPCSIYVPVYNVGAHSPTRSSWHWREKRREFKIPGVEKNTRVPQKIAYKTVFVQHVYAICKEFRRGNRGNLKFQKLNFSFFSAGFQRFKLD